MAIANKFLHFNTKAEFLNKLSEYVTYDESANTYTVKEGDSLWKIANKYNTTINKLKTINNLNTTMLKVGQKLLLPTT